ncbi:MAG: lipopolysaccharide kinase InaA family protein [Verrucomicrobiota bacterium]
MNFVEFSLGGFRGLVRQDLVEGLSESRLSSLHKEVATASEGVLARRRNQVVVREFKIDRKPCQVAVKSFGRQAEWKDGYDKKRGTKAARSFEAAVYLQDHGVGTPPPLAYLERWDGDRIAESFYLSAYLGELQSFKTRLTNLYASKGPCAELVSLLEQVATAVRKMHDAGFYHRDLGNQNIELLPDSPSGDGAVQFLDLNRGRIRDQLSPEERAKDFARLNIPSAFLLIFIRLYWNLKTPKDFERQVNKQRRLFTIWQKSRLIRHPIKSIRKAWKLRNHPTSRIEDIWIWDDRSAQASIMLNKADRRRCYSWLNHCKVAYSNLKAIKSVKRSYDEQLKKAFSDKVDLSQRIGMSLEPADVEFEPQLEFLYELGHIPVLLRFGHHESREQWDRTLHYLNQIHEQGHSIMVAILQDREASLKPESWTSFLEYIFSNIAGKVETVEIGHAMNRVKWGVHNLTEYRRLMLPVMKLRKKYPQIGIVGPACIDFELHHTVAALDHLPKGLQFDALSHLLYVDRRGAPENKQGRFATVEKAALLKAIASTSDRCNDRVLVSETNWPLEYTAEWSPVAASHVAKGTRGSRVHVTEEQYGNYMIRYLALVLCSGLVERVYWWRLVAHGFGLVDERDPGGWRKRIAFKMLQTFLQELGQATFIEKLDMPESVYALKFVRDDGEIALLWCNARKYEGPWPLAFDKALDSKGEAISLSEVGDEPVYLIKTKQRTSDYV